MANSAKSCSHATNCYSSQNFVFPTQLIFQLGAHFGDHIVIFKPPERLTAHYFRNHNAGDLADKFCGSDSEQLKRACKNKFDCVVILYNAHTDMSKFHVHIL